MESVAAARFLDELKAIVGDEYVYYHPEDLLVYEYDGSHRPRAAGGSCAAYLHR